MKHNEKNISFRTLSRWAWIHLDKNIHEIKILCFRLT